MLPPATVYFIYLSNMFSSKSSKAITLSVLSQAAHDEHHNIIYVIIQETVCVFTHLMNGVQESFVSPSLWAQGFLTVSSSSSSFFFPPTLALSCRCSGSCLDFSLIWTTGNISFSVDQTCRSNNTVITTRKRILTGLGGSPRIQHE